MLQMNYSMYSQIQEQWPYYPVVKMTRLLYHSFLNFPLLVENHIGSETEWWFFKSPIKTQSWILLIPGKTSISFAFKAVQKKIVFPKERCPIRVLWDQSHDERLVTSTWRDWKMHSEGYVCTELGIHIHKITK